MSGLTVFLVDPSLFTAPYDVELFRGLVENDVTPTLITRGLRPEEALALGPDATTSFFYRWSDGRRRSRSRYNKILKALEHAIDDVRLSRMVRRERPDVVHLQWSVLPLLDTRMIRRIRSRTPVVFTVHDSMPFNGAQTSRWQIHGFDAVCEAASHLIVHTASAAASLERRGIARERISIVEHGPLPIAAPVRARARGANTYTFVAFGKLRPYKGLDVLIEALASIPPDDRSRVRCIIAGESLMETGELKARIAALDLDAVVELRLHHHDDIQMAELFSAADCFVFPYREIEASGVFHLVRQFERWTIASALGDFAERVVDGRDGQLVPPGDVVALSAAMRLAASRQLAPLLRRDMIGWNEIGAKTRRVYEDVILRHSSAIAR